MNTGLVVDLLTSLKLVCTEFAQTMLDNFSYFRKRDHAFNNLTVKFLSQVAYIQMQLIELMNAIKLVK